MDPGADVLRRIVQECPSVQILIPAPNIGPYSMLAMSDAACHVALPLTPSGDELADEPYMQKLGASCSNITSMELFSLSRDLQCPLLPGLLAFLETPKPHIRRLNLLSGEDPSAVALLDFLASALHSLEEIKYRGECLPPETVQKFLVANPALRDITMFTNPCTCLPPDCFNMRRMPTDMQQSLIRKGVEMRTKYWPNLAAVFVQCMTAGNVECHCRYGGGRKLFAVESKCLSARNKRLSLSFCGVQYI